MQRLKSVFRGGIMLGFFGLILLAPDVHAASAKNKLTKTLPLLFADDFAKSFEAWQTTDKKRPFWEIKEITKKIGENPSRVLRVLGESDYQPPYRSPASIALLKDVCVSDFELQVELQSTNKNAGPHRDLCLFWGYQDASHFYYVHLGAKADDHACQIFIVNDAPRVKITTRSATGTPWTDGWHHVKIIRNAESGLMKVYFDDMDKPLMEANDKTFTSGQVGLGTFDDHGNFDNFRLLGELVSRADTQEKSIKEKLTAKDAKSAEKK